MTWLSLKHMFCSLLFKWGVSYRTAWKTSEPWLNSCLHCFTAKQLHMTDTYIIINISTFRTITVLLMVLTETMTSRHICDVLNNHFSKNNTSLEHLAVNGVVVLFKGRVIRTLCTQEAQMLWNNSQKIVWHQILDEKVGGTWTWTIYGQFLFIVWLVWQSDKKKYQWMLLQDFLSGDNKLKWSDTLCSTRGELTSQVLKEN